MTIKAVSVAIDGLAIIAASTLTAPIKAVYSRGWATWEEWCNEQDLNLVDVTDDDIVRFGDTVAGLTPRQRYDFCLAVLRVYKEAGRESFAKSSKVRDLLSDLKAEFSGIYLPPPVAGRSACAHDRWVRRFVAWCEANDKQALPATPEDVAAFLDESAKHYSYHEIDVASAGISRYQRENGFPGTSRCRVVTEMRAEIKHRNAGRQKPVGVGSSPSSLRKEKGMQGQWRLWCSERGVDVMEATSAEVVDYLCDKESQESPSYKLDALGCISRMYQPGVDPTDCEDVKAVVRVLANRRYERQQQNAHRRLVAAGDRRTRRGQSSDEPGSLNKDVLEFMISADEEMPPELSEEDVENIKSARAASMAAGTLNGYMLNGWKPYVQWCKEMGISVEDARPQHVEAHLCFLVAKKKLLPDVVAIRLNGIRYFYRQLRPFDNPAEHPSVARALSGLRRKNPRAPSQMSPIRESDYERIAEVAQQPRAWETEREAIIRGAFDIALIGLMRDALLRIGEASKVRWSDLERRTDGTGALTIRKSKTDQEGKGQVRFVTENSMLALDAWRSINLSLGVVLSADDRIFPLCEESLRQHIRAACQTAGLKGRYGGHSCRVGMAQDLAAEGYSLVEIQEAGRWDNQRTVLRYISKLAVLDGAVAKRHRSRVAASGVAEGDRASYGLSKPYVGARMGG